MLGTTRFVYSQARAAAAELYHLHDPELIPVGLLLKLAGHRVVMDLHEDTPRQILDKPWIAPLLRRPAAWAMSAVEHVVLAAFDLVVAATPVIADRFPDRKTVIVQNFPDLAELGDEAAPPLSLRGPIAAYVGNVADTRGAREIVDAIGRVRCGDARLRIVGQLQPAELADELAEQPGWSRTTLTGFLDRAGVAEELNRAMVGLCTLHPTPAYLEAQPVKLYEYLSVGLPVVLSDFPRWRHIEREGCGLAVDPLDSRAIAEALEWVFSHPDLAQEMGERGRRLVRDAFNWDVEAERLTRSYDRLLREPQRARRRPER
ncbi:MAG: glycosyltransferase [Acidimicrobiia bacterium]|nr:glycosyltransferase [Acidimicrobiia bacterium]